MDLLDKKLFAKININKLTKDNKFKAFYSKKHEIEIG